VSPQLPGLARDGGYWTVNLGGAWGFSDQAFNAHAFQFSLGSEYRLVLAPGHPLAGWERWLGFANVAGGSSEDAESPLYASQLTKWLTVDYHRVPMSIRDVRLAAEHIEIFSPPLP
jgi:hypothetical protein